jgi:phospholipid/cholesterol/gamma-HCH transport system substrate-binding protein
MEFVWILKKLKLKVRKDKILKYTKEIKIGLIAIISIALIVVGVNFLKGSSFFGGDEVYYGYFNESGGLMPASSVAVNGVSVGKVTAIEFLPFEKPQRRVRVTFNIQNHDIKLPKGVKIEIGALDLFNKAIILQFPEQITNVYLPNHSKIQGEVAKDMMQQMQAYADPITKKLTKLMNNVDRVVGSFAEFWDTTATSEIQGSLIEIRTAVKRFGKLTGDVEGMVADERLKLSSIMFNVLSITENINKNNREISSILGNTKRITDDMVTADFKGTISDAHRVINTLNKTLEEAEKGNGNLAKLLKDEALYNDLVKSNLKLQDLLVDVKENPKRYVHFSVFGRKDKKKVEKDIVKEKKKRKKKEQVHIEQNPVTDVHLKNHDTIQTK